ncbi:hypothetical protein BHYA_0141g00180 [Botrytis hyacinthi]|uniref:Uncharacterized protein n=1 Tax=Botrytis hyacinthi TaxID=278943 RepID=A0A4Z1GIE2_9HELO|nr:hypothetical protein BHYA_0141g00180 [Botrytis hyacinthi]
MARTKNFHHRDRLERERERPLPRRAIIPQDVSDKLASPTILPSAKVIFSASSNAEMLAWEAFQEAVGVQTRAQLQVGLGGCSERERDREARDSLAMRLVFTLDTLFK